MNTLMRKTNGNGNLPGTSFSGIVDKIFQDNLTRFFDDDFWGYRGLEHNTQVPANIRETGTSYELELVAPGLKKEDFKVNVTGEQLTVSLEHQEENNQENTKEGWVRREYNTRSFTRSFNLGEKVEAGKITAEYTNGILYLTLPKKESAQSLTRAIEIQ